ncbi:MAG: Ca-activated chloride channel family protein [Gammaproteobacteria bacterium]|jgi:Ca-activated chloride channel family protein
MLAEDVLPDRLSLAGAAARQLIQSDFDGETGLVVFASAAFVVSPLTRDGNSLLEFINVLQPSTMPVDGGRLDLAIDQARILLEASLSRTGQILAITDGANPAGRAVQAASDAQHSGNQIATIGIGTVAGAPIKQKDGGLPKNSEGNYVLARLDISELEAIASPGQGTITLLASAPAELKTVDAKICHE